MNIRGLYADVQASPPPLRQRRGGAATACKTQYSVFAYARIARGAEPGCKEVINHQVSFPRTQLVRVLIIMKKGVCGSSVACLSGRNGPMVLNFKPYEGVLSTMNSHSQGDRVTYISFFISMCIPFWCINLNTVSCNLDYI